MVWLGGGGGIVKTSSLVPGEYLTASIVYSIHVLTTNIILDFCLVNNYHTLK